MRLLIAAAVVALTPRLAWAQTVSPAPNVTRLGSRTTYGPGIVAAEARRVEFELTRAAHVIVLLVDPDGSIQPVFPAYGERTTERAAGRQVVELKATPGAAQATPDVPHAAPPVMRSAQQIAREGERARPRATGDDEPRLTPVTAYWLVIVSDVPTSAEEIEERLGAMTLQFSSMKAELDALARGLVARRTKLWAASYTPAGT